MAQRAVIDVVCEVRLRQAKRGRLPAGLLIDPTPVDVIWRR
jgi:hypothetical protein